MRSASVIRAAGFCSLLLLTGEAHTQEAMRPLWEAGAGGYIMSLPDYRGSEGQNIYLLPIPYLVYRGEKLKVDRERISGLLFLGDWLFTHAFHLTSSVDARACRLIGEATNRLCAGELHQICERGNLHLTEDAYFDIIDGKTAELTACWGFWPARVNRLCTYSARCLRISTLSGSSLT